jgi:hypothetical protein
MGAKDSFICYADTDVATVLARRPEIDRGATDALVQRLFANRVVSATEDGTLGEHANPPEGLVYAAVWPGAAIVCTSQVALDRPSQVDRRFLVEGRGRTVYVHAMHSVVDWFAYAVWGPDAVLQRALSVSSDEEVIEEVGERLPFEQPFWAGAFPATEDDDDDYPLPFHPLELSEAALGNLFGFVFEGYPDMTRGDSVDPFDITLAGYRLNDGSSRRKAFDRR